MKIYKEGKQTIIDGQRDECLLFVSKKWHFPGVDFKTIENTTVCNWSSYGTYKITFWQKVKYLIMLWKFLSKNYYEN